MVRCFVLAGLVVLLPVVANAQGHGAIASVGHVMAVAPRPMTPVAHAVVQPRMQAGPRPVVGARIVSRNGFERPRVRPAARISSRPVGERHRFDVEDRRLKPGCSNVPGLGFDEVHLAAVCGPEAVNGGLSAFGSPFFFPFFDSGFYMPSVPQETVAPETQQPEGSDAENTEGRRRVRDSQPASVVEASKGPERDSEQYVFVRRDGTVFFAVAYAWDNGTLRYVTSEGLRRNIERNALDLEATQQFNEQRGLSFRLPA